MNHRPNVIESKHNQPHPSGKNRATRRGNPGMNAINDSGKRVQRAVKK